MCCDLLKIHYLCGDKDNFCCRFIASSRVVICSKFITFAVTKTTLEGTWDTDFRCNLLKIHYLCGDKDNLVIKHRIGGMLWFAQNSLPLRWQRQLSAMPHTRHDCCDLLKIHYLCGDKDNARWTLTKSSWVVICSKFITFAVTKTTFICNKNRIICCDLLKIHYLCGDKDNRCQS